VQIEIEYEAYPQAMNDVEVQISQTDEGVNRTFLPLKAVGLKQPCENVLLKDLRTSLLNVFISITLTTTAGLGFITEPPAILPLDRHSEPRT
jgi:hypothetical protein